MGLPQELSRSVLEFATSFPLIHGRTALQALVASLA
jgi:hypothetical protein